MEGLFDSVLRAFARARQHFSDCCEKRLAVDYQLVSDLFPCMVISVVPTVCNISNEGYETNEEIEEGVQPHFSADAFFQAPLKFPGLMDDRPGHEKV